jgi:hypothetical protein
MSIPLLPLSLASPTPGYLLLTMTSVDPLIVLDEKLVSNRGLCSLTQCQNAIFKQIRISGVYLDRSYDRIAKKKII